VPTTSLGILLTRLAPVRTANLPAADMPERLDRMDPASDILEPAGSRMRPGGAKSRAVKVLELRSKWGLGITARSSKAPTNGVCGRTLGLYGLGVPRGLSGLKPFCLSRYETGGAKSIGSKTMEFSLNLAGVGNEANAAGGGKGFLAIGAGRRPLIEDMPRGGRYLDEAAELPDMYGPRGPVSLRNRGGARGGGVIARRVMGSEKGALG